MAVVVWVLFGAGLGWLAFQIMAVEAWQRQLTYTIIGIIGAVVGGLLSGLLGDHPSPFHLWNVESWQTAVMGSSLLLFATSKKR